MSPQEAFGIFFILIGCAAPIIIIGVVYYLKKRLEHKQIMAAIEKGTPLSELRPPKQDGALWIRSLTFGIALAIIGVGIWLSSPRHGMSIVALVLFAVGAASIVRAYLSRKYQPQILSSDKNKAAENRDDTCSSAPA